MRRAPRSAPPITFDAYQTSAPTRMTTRLSRTRKAGIPGTDRTAFSLIMARCASFEMERDGLTEIAHRGRRRGQRSWPTGGAPNAGHEADVGMCRCRDRIPKPGRAWWVWAQTVDATRAETVRLPRTSPKVDSVTRPTALVARGDKDGQREQRKPPDAAERGQDGLGHFPSGHGLTAAQPV